MCTTLQNKATVYDIIDLDQCLDEQEDICNSLLRIFGYNGVDENMLHIEAEVIVESILGFCESDSYRPSSSTMLEIDSADGIGTILDIFGLQDIESIYRRGQRFAYGISLLLRSLSMKSAQTAI